MKKGGYFTVEAVFVVSICIWIFAALVFQGLHVHDRVVIESVTNEQTAQWLSKGKEEKAETWKKKTEKVLESRLLLMKVNKIEPEDRQTKVIVKVHYTIPISLPYMKKILSGGSGLSVFETEREHVCGAKYRWDHEALLEKKGE
ncbi:MAG: hypothetical protein J1F22_01165 [Lachnospiraceae bacterium]|nr:hypothetical protein [Lachnospiraceae bacterium]